MLELVNEEPEDKRASWNEKVRIRTLKELGPRLAIGTIDAATGELQKDMLHRRWNLKLEKELGKFRDENRRSNMGHFVSKVLTKIYSQLGALKFSGDVTASEKGVLSIGQMFMGDALHSYFYLRREFLGSEVMFDAACPNCFAPAPIRADLDTLEVRTVESLEDTYWTYALVEPFEIRNVMVENMVMGSARWGAIDAMQGGGLNTGAMKAAMILSSISRIEGLGDIAIAEHELDEMGKRDVELLSDELDLRHLGPDLAVEAQCGKCRVGFRVSIDWSYDTFFGISGRSGP